MRIYLQGNSTQRAMRIVCKGLSVYTCRAMCIYVQGDTLSYSRNPLLNVTFDQVIAANKETPPRHHDAAGLVAYRTLFTNCFIEIK